MIKYIKGDLLTAQTEAIVNTVNTVGVMGKGIALQFKERYPNNFHVYLQACKTNNIYPGKLLVVKDRYLNQDILIINFPTKVEWFKKSQYSYIEDGLKALVQTIQEYGIKSIAIPPLGCGNGGLRWENVKLLIERYLTPISNQVEILIYEPNNEIKEILKQQNSNKNIKLTPARALLLYAMFYYEALGEKSCLFVANKIAYFFQRLGEPSFKKLKFNPQYYGPYSVQVDHLVHALNGKYIKGLEQMTAKPFEEITLMYDTATEVSTYIRQSLDSTQRERLKNLIKLIDGFQSALALEVLASVDFIRKENPNISKQEAIKKIREWNQRKKILFSENSISVAYDHLENYKNTFMLK